MQNKEWKINDIVIIFYKNNKEEKIIDIGIIESFNTYSDDQFADIKLLYSKFSPVNTFIHAPRNEVYIIGNINDLKKSLQMTRFK